MADTKLTYVASSNLTVTNLHSLAASQTWVKGWDSGLIDNSTNKYPLAFLTGKFTLNATGGSLNNPGETRIYVASTLDDTPTYMSPLTASEANAVDFGDTEERDSALILARAFANDNTGGQVHYLAPIELSAVFGGVLPAKFNIFITSNAATSTNACFQASGNQLTIKYAYYTTA